MKLTYLLLAAWILLPGCKAEPASNSLSAPSADSAAPAAEEQATPPSTQAPVPVKVQDMQVMVSRASKPLVAVRQQGSQDTLDCRAQIGSFEAGQQIAVPIFSQELNGLTSLQFTVQFDTSLLSFVDLEKTNAAENANLTFSKTNAAQGTLPVLWYSESTDPGKFDPKLFTLRFMSKRDGILSDALAFNSAEIVTEACYEKPPCQPVRLLFSDETSKATYLGAELALNVFPSPATDYFSIRCPNTGRSFSYRLLKSSGQVVQDGRMPQGGLLRVPRGKLASGIYIVQLEADGALVASQRLILQ